MNTRLMRLHGAVERDPALHLWLRERPGPLGALATHWFAVMRACGDEVRELMHDGLATACLGDVPFAYVGVFTAHVNLGFYQGAFLPDPARLLQGTGKAMRHVKLRPGDPAYTAELNQLIASAYADIKAKIENG